VALLPQSPKIGSRSIESLIEWDLDLPPQARLGLVGIEKRPKDLSQLGWPVNLLTLTARALAEIGKHFVDRRAYA